MKIFVLLPRFPYPLEKGDKLRAYNQIKVLSKSHEIVLCALYDNKISQNDLDQLKPYCSSIHTFHLSKFSIVLNLFKALLKGKPFQVGYFYNSSIHKRIIDLISKHKPDHIYNQLVRTAEYVKDINEIPKTLDYMDAFSIAIGRRISNANFLFKPFFIYEFKALERYERDCFKKFDSRTIISDPDRQMINHPEKDQIQIVKNGVDFDFFFPIEAEKKYDIAFIGGMQYTPNIHAALYIAEKIMPILKEYKPDIKLLIAGAYAVKKILALRSKNIDVTGWVDDIRTCYSSSKILIAPIEIGVGLQNKLLEAMAMKIPCITSQRVNEALGAKPGEDLLIGTSPQEYSQHIISLLEDKEKADKLAQNAYYFVKSNYDWDRITEKLNELISSSHKQSE